MFLEIAGDAAEGVVFVCLLNRDDPRPVVQNFLKSYKKMYGMESEMCATTSYDAFMIIVRAIEKSEPKPDSIRQAIATMKDFPGLLGKVKEFNEIGESKKPVQVQIVKGGQFRFFAEITDPEVITPPSK
jgi:branched-chain amino acid transport system substrate-binding protein